MLETFLVMNKEIKKSHSNGACIILSDRVKKRGAQIEWAIYRMLRKGVRK